MQEDLIYKLALKEVEGVGGILFRNLISVFGTAKNVLEANSGSLLKTPGVGHGLVSSLKLASKNLAAAEELIEESQQKNYRIITFQDAEYPARFKGIYDAPPIVFYRGSANLNFPKTVGIVGTRKATDYGKSITEEIVKELSVYKVAIISGLAYGIDIAAHKAAIKYNAETLAVMAGGLDFIYPAAHKKYVHEIITNGGLLSENKHDNAPIAPQFIARNRINAAMSDVVIVVESAKRGGGLVTAEYGNNYHREVYAVPGRIDQPFSEGPNNLIQKNKAKIYTSVEDLVEEMNWNSSETTLAQKAVALDFSGFTEDESKVLSILCKKEEYLIDNLSFESNIPLNKLAALLLNLEFQDMVKALPGKKFKLK